MADKYDAEYFGATEQPEAQPTAADTQATKPSPQAAAPAMETMQGPLGPMTLPSSIVPPKQTPAAPAQVDPIEQEYNSAVGDHPDYGPMDYLEAAGKRGLGAIIQSVGAVPGGVAGGRAGYKLALQGGKVGARLGPFGMIGGAILGGFAGYTVGDMVAQYTEDLTNKVAVNSIEDLPPELRPAGVAGEVLFGSIPFMMAPLSYGRKVLGDIDSLLPNDWTGRLLRSVLERAGKNPKLFATVETAANVSAATAGAAVETYAPGHPLARAGAEIAAGVLNPYAFLTNRMGGIVNSIRQMLFTHTAAGTRSQASQVLTKYVQAAQDAIGADGDLLSEPQTFLAVLRSAADSGDLPTGTAAQLTGSKIAAHLEAELAEVRRPFQAQTKAMAQRNFQALSMLIQEMRKEGTPAALQTAARLQQDQFEAALATVHQSNLQGAIDAAAKISTELPGWRETASREMSDIVQQSIERARTVEKQLYDELPSDVMNLTSDHKALMQTLGLVRGELESTEKLPSWVAEAIGARRDAMRLLSRASTGATALEDGTKITNKMVRAAEKQLSVREMTKLRGRLLERARGALKATDEEAPTRARHYGMLADSILRDLVRLGVRTVETEGGRRGVGGKFLSSNALTPLDEANAYSRALNDVYKRSFTGKTQGIGSRGEDLLPPELLAKQAFSSGGDELTASRLDDLMQAANFLYGQSGRAADITIEKGMTQGMDLDYGAMLNLQERLVRLAAVAGRGADGRVSAERLRAFMDKAAPLLTDERFPAVRTDLENALKSEEALKQWEAATAGVTRYHKANSVAARILGVESPLDAVRGAIKSPQPVKNLTAMMRLAKESEDPVAATEGLRAAIFDDAIRSAKAGEHVSLADLASALINPLSNDPANPSVMRLMVDEGLMPSHEAERVMQLVQRGEAITEAMRTGALGQQLVEDPNFALDFLVRMAGVAGGAVFHSATNVGHGLIIAQRSSQAARIFAEKMPKEKVLDMLLKAVRGDPVEPGGRPWSLLETLLDTPASLKDLELQVQRIYSSAIYAGLNGVEDEAMDSRPKVEDEYMSRPLSALQGGARAPAPTPVSDQQAGTRDWNTQNNPMNISSISSGKDTSKDWEGTTGYRTTTGPGGAKLNKFETELDGWRAGAQQLVQYGQNNPGGLTPLELMNLWAGKDHPKSQARLIAKEVGVKVGDKMDLTDADTVKKVMRALSLSEDRKKHQVLLADKQTQGIIDQAVAEAMRRKEAAQ